MENTIQISTGAVKLKFTDDFGELRGVLKVNPSDIGEANKIFTLSMELEERQSEYEKKIKQAKTEKEQLEILLESCEYLKKSIDYIYGAGSSLMLFGEANTFRMFEDFFKGITPLYQKASKEKTKKYKQ